MKNGLIIFLLFVLSSINCSSQNLSDIEKLASNYNNAFSVLEKDMNIKPFDTNSKFGLESRVYVIKAFKVLIESNNEENKISKISILTEKSASNHELWYSITKSANADDNFKFVNSFIVSDEEAVFDKDIDFTKMVSILRKSKTSDDYLYYITFKKNNLFYSFNISMNTFFITISETK